MSTETVVARDAPGTKETITRDDVAGWTLPEVTGLRKLLGPDWYRLLRGVVTNPLSVVGLIIVTIFILVVVSIPYSTICINSTWAY